jgi:hypothetical protein
VFKGVDAGYAVTLPILAQGVGAVYHVGVVAGAPEGAVFADLASGVETAVVGEVHGVA